MHVRPRRAFLAGVALSLAGTAGCLFGRADRGEVEEIGGQVVNETGEHLTVTVSLTRPDGTVDFERTYELAPDTHIEFGLEDPADEYTLTIETASGRSTSMKWTVDNCTGWMHVKIEPDEFAPHVSAC